MAVAENYPHPLKMDYIPDYHFTTALRCKMLKRSLISICLAVLVLMSAEAVFACSCATRPTVLDSFESSDLVVATRLVSAEKIREKEREHDIAHIRSATMIVIKVYKGNIKAGQALKFAQGGGGDCVWTFDEEWINEEFLFYLGKPTKGHPWTGEVEDDQAEPMYRAITCGRSNSLEAALDDLAYLDNISKVRGKTRLSGKFAAWFDDSFTGSDIKLKIAGKTRTYAAKTDKNGFFEVYDLEPGEYVVTLDLPHGWKINDYMLERTATGFEEYDPRAKAKSPNQIPVVIRAGRHAVLDLVFDVDTAIKGRVLSPAGKPMKDVCVTAVSTDLQEGDYRGPSNCTDAKGEFVIEEMVRGNYYLVANSDGRMDDGEPFGVVFYPGVTDFKNAGVVAVEPGKHATGRTIQIPQTVELVTINGRFLYSDNKPVRGEWVKFEPDDKKRFDEIRVETDDAGRFVFRLPKGAAGTVSANKWINAEKFKNCPKVDGLLKEAGEETLTVHSSVIRVDSLVLTESIEIVLPIPYCEEAKPK